MKALRLAARIAWREGKSSSLKFLVVVLGVAAGVGALAGVRGFSAAFQSTLLKEARTLMAADLTVRLFSIPTEAQEAALKSYRDRGAQQSQITETVSMMSGSAPDPVLVSVKAVNPREYPFYGKVRLDPERPLSELLDSSSIAISDDLLTRLQVKTGDMVKLGAEQFKICGIVRAEPDRMTGSLNVGPRVMVTREGLERTGLLQFGSRAAQRFLFKLPAQGIDVDEMRASLKKSFPEAQVVNYRETHPAITRALDRSTTFLSLVSLIALIVGALGVATAVHSHLQQKLDTIAVMKCLGARSSQIIGIYTLQTLMLGLTGGFVGLLFGAGVQELFPALIRRYFQFEGGIPWNPAFALEGLAVGMLVTLLFTLPALLSIRKIRPALILRREVSSVRMSWTERVRSELPSLGAGLLLAGGLGAVAGWLAQSPQMGAMFIGGLLVSLLILAGIAWVLLRAVKLVLQRAPVRWPIAVRQGAANLYRPGNHAGSVLVSLGIGVMFTLTVYLVQHSLLTEVMNAAPPGMPNVFLINITEREREGITEILNRQEGKLAPPQMTPLVAARLVSIDGKPLADMGLKGFARRFQQTRSITWVEEKPKDAVVRQGEWWTKQTTDPVLSVSEDVLDTLKVSPGQVMRWSATGRDIDARIVSVHRNQSVAFGGNSDFLFNAAALKDLPVQWFGSIRLPATRVGALQKLAYEKYPSVTVINAAEVLSIVQEVVDQVALMVRFISAFAILAGVIILASTVAGTRLRRMREAAVLKTLGARRNRLIAIFSIEFLILGVVAGLIGSLLATAFSRLLLTRLLDAQFRVDWIPNLITVALTAALAVSTGWLASLRVLKQKPLEVLREE